LKCALKKTGFECTIGASLSQLKGADIVVLPGVGSFSTASGNFGSLKGAILERAKSGTHIFGICLGMQLLFSQSEEGEGEGLALCQGKNVRLPSFVKTPHMGWNTLNKVRENRLLKDIENGSYVYFVHSYYPVPEDNDITIAETTYGLTFPSVIARQNIYATQFHPEKSGQPGAKILINLLEIARR
jgi:glutamine amidotransferase